MSENLPDFYTIGPLQTVSLGSLTIPTYYLVISLTCCLCIVWLYKRTPKYNLPVKTALDLCMVILVGGFIGARLTHVFFEFPGHYLKHPLQVLYFWQGGFVFYGGAIGGYLAGVWFIRKKSDQFWEWHDLSAPIAGLGYALGRLGCFMQGCCYGKICQFPWAISLKQADTQTQQVTEVLRHPTQLYATFWELGVVGLLLYVEKKRKLRAGSLFFLWIGFHAVGRILMEVYREDFRGPSVSFVSISMFISFVLIGFSLWGLRFRSE